MCHARAEAQNCADHDFPGARTELGWDLQPSPRLLGTSSTVSPRWPLLRPRADKASTWTLSDVLRPPSYGA